MGKRVSVFRRKERRFELSEVPRGNHVGSVTPLRISIRTVASWAKASRAVSGHSCGTRRATEASTWSGETSKAAVGRYALRHACKYLRHMSTATIPRGGEKESGELGKYSHQREIACFSPRQSWKDARAGHAAAVKTSGVVCSVQPTLARCLTRRARLSCRGKKCPDRASPNLECKSCATPRLDLSRKSRSTGREEPWMHHYQGVRVENAAWI